MSKHTQKIVSTIGIILSFIFIISFLSGCDMPKREAQEQPSLYYKDIDVVVENVDQRHWYAGTHRYRMSIKVRSDEYGLEKIFDLEGSGMFGLPEYWNKLHEGDVIQAEMYSWVVESTGEIVRRDLHRLL